MLSLEVNREIKKISEAINEADYLFDFLGKTNKYSVAMNNIIANIASSGNKALSSVNEFNNYLIQYKKNVSVKPRLLFNSIDKLESKINEVIESGLEETSGLLKINKKLSNYIRIYEDYIDDYSVKHAWHLIHEGQLLYELLTGVKEGLGVYKNVEINSFEYENGRELSVILNSPLNLPQFIKKLQSLEIIYNEICMISNINTVEHPLQILKIESGSLWAKVFGNSKIIELIIGFIQSGASYVYRNFTTEGKLTGIPKKVQAIEEILKLTSKLDEMGIDISDSKDHLAKSTVIIAKQLNVLLSGEPEVIINETKISIGSEIQKKLIESDRLLKLEQDDN